MRNDVVKSRLAAYNIYSRDLEDGFEHCRDKLHAMHCEGVFTGRSFQAALKMLHGVFKVPFTAAPVKRNVHLSMTVDDLTLIAAKAETIRTSIEQDITHEVTEDPRAVVSVKNLRISTEKYCEFDGHISHTDSNVRASYTLDIRKRIRKVCTF